jgi:Kef-type K+ transport system membrane component KefB
MVVAGVLVAMIGFYQVLTSGDESQIKTWTNTIIYGVIWILIMFAAKYLTGVIFDWIFAWWTW